VTKVHLQVARLCRDGHEVVLIGHRGHPEVEGTMGQCRDGGGIHLVETARDVAQLQIEDQDHVAFVTQTTLSIDDTAEIIDALRRRFPNIDGPRKSDICYATQNRQDAVKQLAQQAGLVLVVGSPNSSNSNRLREIADKLGTPAYLIDGADDIRREWLQGVDRVGVTAGASAPEVLVEQVILRLQEWGAANIHEADGKPEQVVFSLPRELRGEAVQ
jgi:4-hydroxy-3-methylbut-2-enyl diphosphate reductase